MGADGVFYAELNELLTRELSSDGYAGVEVRVTPLKTEIIIRATRARDVLGEKGRRIRELTSLVQKRFKFPEGSVELYAERVNNSLRHRAVRVRQVQAHRWPCLPSCLLWRGPLRHGVWRQGLRGDRQWQAAWPACQVHEVQGWLLRLLWPAVPRFRRDRHPPRAHAHGYDRYLRQDHASLGSGRQAWSQATDARCRHRVRAQRRRRPHAAEGEGRSR